MSTATTMVDRSVRHTVLYGIACALITSTFATPLKAEFVAYGSPGNGASEIRRWNDCVSKAECHTATTEVGRWIDDLEQQLHVTRAGLAALLGVSRPTLYSWARGEGIRDANAQRLQAFRAAAALLVANAPEGAMPALWQHQRLPTFGMSFAQGIAADKDPESMAREIVGMWTRDRIESDAVDKLFAKRG